MKKPILIAGLPRTGTTWIASVLGATRGTAYFHEPFNYQQVKESTPFCMRYVRAADTFPEFAAYCHKCFSGRQHHGAVTGYQSKWRRRLSFLPHRVLIKDVHSLFALDWIDRHIGPQIVLILRHPLAVADSWFRMANGKNEQVMGRILDQPTLLEDHLRPHEAHIRSADDFWSRMGVYWAACYYIVLQQQRSHPDWIVVRHEDFVEDPAGRFRDLCARLELPWTSRTERYLRDSNAEDSGETFVPRRILAEEKDKWRKNLSAAQIETVNRAIAPFQIPFYTT